MLQSSEFVDLVCTDTKHKVHWVAAEQFADIVALHSEHRVQCGAVGCYIAQCTAVNTVQCKQNAGHCIAVVQLLFGCCKSPAPSPVACVGLLNTKTNLLLSIIIISAGEGRCQTQKYQRSEIATLRPLIRKTSI